MPAGVALPSITMLVLLAEYLAASGVSLCPACLQHDGRRAAALIERPEYKNSSVEQILQGCGLCDAHGFLVTAKNANNQQGTEARQRNAKDSLVEFSFALGLPEHSQETMHLFTRTGDSKEEGQMLMKKPARSGDYALEVRYRSVGIGVDTDSTQRCRASTDVLCLEGRLRSTSSSHGE
jgi:CRISPR-associated negative auto-regulator DevR/Csa2